MIREMSKTDHRSYYSTELDESHKKTVTEHIEDDDRSFSDVVQKCMDRRYILSKYLLRLSFQYKVIGFAKYFISKYNAKMIMENQQ